MICNLLNLVLENHQVILSIVMTSCILYSSRKKGFKLNQNLANKISCSVILIKGITAYACRRFFHYFNDSVREVGKNKYEVTYTIKGKTYKMIVKQFRGPSPVLQILDHNLNDRTDEILPYLGPNYDCKHAQEFDLEMFHVESLTFEFGDGTTNTVLRK